MKPNLSIDRLTKEAKAFAALERAHSEPMLFGVTDGKAVGTYVELKFRKYLSDRYEYAVGNAAKGIDFPALDVDLKVTSARQPQSSCPYKSARQKIYGLGYSLLVLVYKKQDDDTTRTANLNIVHVVFVAAKRTADFQTTSTLRKILENEGNADDLIACMIEKNLPIDEIGATALAADMLHQKPEQGYLTISNALQWRLQYGRVIEKAGTIDGILRIE